MSDPSSRSNLPEKPAWLRRSAKDAASSSTDATAEQRATGKPNKPVSRGSVAPQFVIASPTNAAVLPTGLGLREWLRREFATNRDGLLTSMGLHLGLLLLFAWHVLPAGGQGSPALINVGWTSPEAMRAQAALNQPVKIENLQIGPARTSATLSELQAKTNEDQTTATKRGPGDLPTKLAAAGGALASRSGSNRSTILQNLKADKSERGISGGLAWLSRQQGKGGNWRLHEGYPDAGESVIRTDAGATALALLAFLGDGHTTTEGTHAKVVAKGIVWLKSIQKANGDFHDHEELGRQTAFYAHSQATIAMCEAYAITGDPSLKLSCERAIKFLLDSQHPQNGGWRYQPQSGESMGDLSVTGWALMALHSARMAKLNVPFDNFERASLFLESVSEQNGSRYKYQPMDPLEKVLPAMTAEGLLCRQWLGWPKDHPPQREAIKYLLSEDNQPTWNPGQRNVYAWYYTAQVLHNLGGEPWEQWYQQVSQLILSKQAVGAGPVGGSWHPKQPPGAGEEYSEKAGRLYFTAMCLLVLETPFRHAPVYENSKSE